MAQVKRVSGPGKQELDFLLKGLATNQQGKVGWFESAQYESMGGRPPLPVSIVAMWNEFGNRRIPARPFFRPTIAEKQQEWRNVVVQGAQRIKKGQATARDVLDTLGQLAAAQVAAKIASINTPALDPSTVRSRKWKKARGYKVGSFTKPLQESGYMISTINSTVEEAQ